MNTWTVHILVTDLSNTMHTFLGYPVHMVFHFKKVGFSHRKQSTQNLAINIYLEYLIIEGIGYILFNMALKISSKFLAPVSSHVCLQSIKIRKGGPSRWSKSILTEMPLSFDIKNQPEDTGTVTRIRGESRLSTLTMMCVYDYFVVRIINLLS